MGQIHEKSMKYKIEKNCDFQLVCIYVRNIIGEEREVIISLCDFVIPYVFRFNIIFLNNP